MRPKPRSTFLAVASDDGRVLEDAPPGVGESTMELQQAPTVLPEANVSILRPSRNVLMADSARVDRDQLRAYGKANGFRGWWRRAVQKNPVLAMDYIREHSMKMSMAAAGQLQLPGKVDLTAPEHWESFRAEAETGCAVLDSACDRTMMGGNNKPALQRWLARQGYTMVAKFTM